MKKVNQFLHIKWKKIHKWEWSPVGLKHETTVKITGTGKEGKRVCYDEKMNCKTTCQISTGMTMLHLSRPQICCFWDQEEFEWCK